MLRNTLYCMVFFDAATDKTITRLNTVFFFRKCKSYRADTPISFTCVVVDDCVTRERDCFTLYGRGVITSFPFHLCVLSAYERYTFVLKRSLNSDITRSYIKPFFRAHSSIALFEAAMTAFNVPSIA